MKMMRQPFQMFVLAVVTLGTISYTNAFSVIPRPVSVSNTLSQTLRHVSAMTRLAATTNQEKVVVDRDEDDKSTKPLSGIAAGATALGLMIMLGSSSLSSPAYADDVTTPDIYSDDTVVQAVNALNQAKGDTDATLKAYDTVAGIITEGKGVGGQIDYKGVQLNRGYVADEDTSIYNPGLTLLTESEKMKLTRAVVDARKAGQAANTWNEDNEFAYGFLKQKLDPLHMLELSGYLSIVPFYVTVLYVATVAVQQFKREFFTVAYLVAAAAFFLPIAALLALGP